MNTERQIHHYGSGLNALVLLSAFHDNPSDSYLLRVAYGGTTGALSNINQHGFASCAMHAWPENLFWDAYSGDYGPNFLGLTLGSGTYLVQDTDLGIVVYGGVLQLVQDLAVVQVRDSVRQKIFVGPLEFQVRVDTGIIKSFTYRIGSRAISVVLGIPPDGPQPEAWTLWIMGNTANSRFGVKVAGKTVQNQRGGYRVPFLGQDVRVDITAQSQSRFERASYLHVSC